MSSPNILTDAGARPTKPTKYVPININRWITGLWTQRNPLRDPSDRISELYYHGRPDAFIDGENIEITNKLTPARRPGLKPFSSQIIPESPDFFYSFKQLSTDGTGSTVKVVVDTPSNLYWLTPTTISTIWAKSAGASQTSCLGVGHYMYFGDGVEQKKWDGTTVWNWGIAAPTAAPTLNAVESGSAATKWQANTNFTTMGLLDDGTNVQQLISVNADGSNPNSQFGTSGNGQPSWNQAGGGTTTDGTVTWTNRGPVGLWQPNSVYSNFSNVGTLTNPCVIYDPASGALYGNTNAGGASGTSGAGRPNFTGVNGGTIKDNGGNNGTGISWFCINAPAPGVWQPSHTYTQIGTVSGNDSNCSVTEPISMAKAYDATSNSFTQEIFWQVATTGGTSGVGGTAPQWGTQVGNITTPDGQLSWLCLGSKTRQTNTNYIAWALGQQIFSVIKDTNNNFQVCTTGGLSSNTATASITWATTYGDTTNDGAVIWTCVGKSLSWTANRIWHLPATGFAPPQPSQSYGGSSIVGTSDNDVIFVINSGESGSGAEPTWNPIGQTTTDNTITWYNQAPFSSQSLVWKTSIGYVFSFKARSANDPYVTTTPPGQNVPLGPPLGSADGSISSASAATALVGANTGAVVTVSGLGSTDPQVDTIEIYRTLDGGSSYFFLTDIVAPPAINGVAQPWSFQDTIPDSDLNQLILAPVDGANNPPPQGLTNLEYHYNRVWGSVGSIVYYSNGPITQTATGPVIQVGNGFTAFQVSSNYVSFPGLVKRLYSTSSSLLVFTTSGLFAIVGSPTTAGFFGQPFNLRLPISSYNAVHDDGGVYYLITADRQCATLDINSGVSQIGYPIGVDLSTFNPANVYVTYHRSGSQDDAVFVADGSTGWYRGNPHLAPDGGVGGAPVWSPKANIVGGCKAVQSIETEEGIFQLLVGSVLPNQPVLVRDLNTFQDNFQSYPAHFTMGGIVLAQPGQIAEIAFLSVATTTQGSLPTLSIMFDEIAAPPGEFLDIPRPVSEPPLLPVSQSYRNNRYYLNNIQSPAWCLNMQIRMDFPAEGFENEILGLTIYAAVKVND
jgi:hypothetical protein